MVLREGMLRINHVTEKLRAVRAALSKWSAS